MTSVYTTRLGTTFAADTVTIHLSERIPHTPRRSTE
jgi:hypothetical protein